MEKLRMAVAYGADAVYLAGTSFGMRSFTANFTPDELPQAISLSESVKDILLRYVFVYNVAQTLRSRFGREGKRAFALRIRRLAVEAVHSQARQA